MSPPRRKNDEKERCRREQHAGDGKNEIEISDLTAGSHRRAA
ncbi:hypothetical protein OHAE_3536 [Ochrobactrum soli]|uniref:Uncharacterized protein n=1 Tax=Ochrobactrum soli TaxID=2448455 RepID=A0A2P9HHL2_9HYPH|nr:hypothetical protein OHAE_3536 [[Ochrobactrum] soli]